jgi:hypothetical protein
MWPFRKRVTEPVLKVFMTGDRARVEVDWPRGMSAGERAAASQTFGVLLALTQTGELSPQVQAAVALSGASDPDGPSFAHGTLASLGKVFPVLGVRRGPVVAADEVIPNSFGR